MERTAADVPDRHHVGAVHQFILCTCVQIPTPRQKRRGNAQHSTAQSSGASWQVCILPNSQQAGHRVQGPCSRG